jgi:hypothetical protein
MRASPGGGLVSYWVSSSVLLTAAYPDGMTKFVIALLLTRSMRRPWPAWIAGTPRFATFPPPSSVLL